VKIHKGLRSERAVLLIQMTTKFCLRNNKGIIYSKVLGVYEVIILKIIFDNGGVICWIRLSWLQIFIECFIGTDMSVCVP